MLATNRDSLRPRPYRVLVVDDHVDTLEVLLELFGLLGHHARGAASGREGLRIARDFDPELILLDIQLPDISGYQVARALRADKRLRGCYLAAVTGWARPSDVVVALSHGFDQHVTKPFDVITLRQMIGAVTARKRATARPRRASA